MPDYAHDTFIELRRIPTMRPLRGKQMMDLLGRGQRRRVRKGTELVPSDGPVSSVWFVLDGDVRLETPRGPDRVWTPPTDVGLLPLLAEAGVGGRAVAASTLKAVQVPREHILDVIDSSPAHRLALIQDLAGALLDGPAGGFQPPRVATLPSPGDPASDDARFTAALTALAAVEPTTSAPVASLTDLAWGLAWRTFDAGDAPVDPKSVAIVARGELEFGGRRYGPGAHLGWIEACADVDRESVVARRPGVAWVYEGHALLAAARQHPEVGRALLLELARALLTERGWPVA